MPFYPKVLRVRECAPTPSLSIVFTFGFIVESIKEFEGALSNEG
jgi:hypothetical protein